MPVSIYDHPAWRSVAGQAMRPGGLAVTRQALEYCMLPPHARVLDVGCGAGATLRVLAAESQLLPFGVDSSGICLEHTRQSDAGLRLARAFAEHLPLVSESVNAAFFECTLSLLDTGQSLSECARVLQPGGYLVVSDIYARSESGITALKQLPAGSCLSGAMTRPQIIEKIEQVGLSIAFWQDYPEAIKQFPVCTLTTAFAVDPFDLVIATARARLGYFMLIARKE